MNKDLQFHFEDPLNASHTYSNLGPRAAIIFAVKRHLAWCHNCKSTFTTICLAETQNQLKRTTKKLRVKPNCNLLVDKNFKEWNVPPLLGHSGGRVGICGIL